MISIGPSGVHGQGAFAARDIGSGERIGIYRGRRYTARQAALRDWPQALTYVFGLGDGSVIDASDQGDATRHFNHSCEPNVIAYEESGARGRRDIVFYALRPVRTGEELFIDYSLDIDPSEDPGLFACRCGVPTCRGTMLAADGSVIG